MGTNFAGFPHSRGFTAFSLIWEIDEKTHAFSHMMKYTTKPESNGKNTHAMETVWEPISF